MKDASNAPHTPELETPIGFMSRTKIDQKCAEITRRIMAGTDNEGDHTLREQLMDIRRQDLFTLPGETAPRRQRTPL